MGPFGAFYWGFGAVLSSYQKASMQGVSRAAMICSAGPCVACGGPSLSGVPACMSGASSLRLWGCLTPVSYCREITLRVRWRGMEEEPKTEPLDKEAIIGRLLGYGFMAVLMVVLVALIYGGLNADRLGLWWHNRDAAVYLDGDWLVGEYRICTKHRTLSELDCRRGLPPGTVVSSGIDLSAGFVSNEPPHILPVRFWGQLRRTRWRCQREADRLNCRRE